MLHETDQQFMSTANSAMRGHGRGRGSSTLGGSFGQTGGRSFSSRGRRKINQGARFARSLIMKQLIAGTDFMKNIKLRKDMHQLLHRLMVLTQTGTQMQGLPIMSQEN
jgi:hypothetical protein